MKTEEIQALINCPKRLYNKPRKSSKVLKGSERNDFKLISKSDKDIIFRVFMRKSIIFPENFSIGLVYLTPSNQDVTLLRYNGIHQHKNKVINNNQFENFHIHQATCEALSEGFAAESYAIETRDYDTYEKALFCFWKDIKIQEDIDLYFDLANIDQLKLDF